MRPFPLLLLTHLRLSIVFMLKVQRQAASSYKTLPNARKVKIEAGKLLEFPPPGTCGEGNFGNGVCADTSNCCSEFGWCGTTDAHCNPKTCISGPGCPRNDLSGVGICGEGSIGNGTCADTSYCCSEFGWCGKTAALCDPKTCISGPGCPRSECFSASRVHIPQTFVTNDISLSLFSSCHILDTGEIDPCPGAQGSASIQLWYTLLGDDSMVRATSALSRFNTRLSVFAGTSCTSLRCIAFNDDIGNSFQSEIKWFAVADQMYYIRLDDSPCNFFHTGSPNKTTAAHVRFDYADKAPTMSPIFDSTSTPNTNRPTRIPSFGDNYSEEGINIVNVGAIVGGVLVALLAIVLIAFASCYLQLSLCICSGKQKQPEEDSSDLSYVPGRKIGAREGHQFEKKGHHNDKIGIFPDRSIASSDDQDHVGSIISEITVGSFISDLTVSTDFVVKQNMDP